MNQNRTSGYAAALMYSVIIGFSFIFVKIALEDAGPLDILAHRFTLSFAAATIPILFGWVRLQIKWKKDLLYILPLALFYPVLFFTFQVFGLVYTTTSEAGIIQAAIPIFTMLLAAYFLKERTRGWQLAATLVSVFGVMFIFMLKGLDVRSSSLIGSLLILLSSLSSAGYNVMARKLGGKWDVFTLTYVMTAAGFVLFNAMALGEHLRQGALGQYFAPFAKLPFLMAILYLGILSSLLTSYLSNFALSKLEASQMSVFANLATLISILAGVIVLNEHLEWFHYIGGLCILLGVIGRNLLPRPKKRAVSRQQGASSGL
ncbi:DMT family transporter [Paenibacillus roseus]|uniref:DMT family transporter n=1 Tax=Paenibacillus roseus TaxID=2798579 RepID=A0A934MQ28_9BACL|nr:DMT family transporter [Paenibacillus roseus]MBJ6362711.1 DMT family transporter [Paenibacillus roseus]